MKSVAFLCFALVLSAFSQEVPNTVDDLLAAQAELTIGHEFTETLLTVNRNVISSYIEIVEQQLIDSFMDSYAEIQILYDDTEEQLRALEQNPCVERVINRWELQSTRYGNRLSECLTNSVIEIKAWNDQINSIHSQSQMTTTTQAPNAGFAVLSERDDYTSRERLGRDINFRFRTLLTRARPYLDRYEEFRASVVDNEEEIIAELTQCDRALVAAFNNEAREDLALGRSCLAV